MITTTHIQTCHNCNSTNIIKNGKNKNGNLRYKCKDCGITKVLNYKPKYTEQEKEKILRAYQERSSIRGVCRIFGIAKQTLANWVKKKQKLYQTY